MDQKVFPCFELYHKEEKFLKLSQRKISVKTFKISMYLFGFWQLLFKGNQREKCYKSDPNSIK